MYSIEDTFESAGLNSLRTIYWDQGTSVHQNDDGPTPVVEFIYLLTRDNMTAPHYHKRAASKQFQTSLWHIKKERSDIHPCAFPALLVENCILLNSSEGDIIMDPYAGSGSVLLAVHNPLSVACVFYHAETMVPSQTPDLLHNIFRNIISACLSTLFIVRRNAFVLGLVLINAM